ncbi:hypothetical protein B296_00031882 [Ensete ventricosum]|uniref:Uncharacterized protein n=1 Tax=Ensete ventricosum TaxID=4639 RepID=A0A426XD29_ENSVE|nr:hypothetical protein B296_00031882 [Ensete ventricosum]
MAYHVVVPFHHVVVLTVRRASVGLGNLIGAGADPTEWELGNLNGAGADPTEQELRNLNGVGADPTEQELGNLNGAGANPTELELGNLNLGFCREDELGHRSWGFGQEGAQILGIWPRGGIDPGDLAERVNSGINPEDLAERVNSSIDPGDLAKRVGMTSSDSSSRVRVVSSPGLGETSRCDPEVGSSGASSGPPLLVDVRVLRDLEVMKSDHDLDTAVTEGSLAVIRERYSIPIEYGLHFVDLGSTNRHTRSATPPHQMDLGELCGMPKVTSGKVPPTRPTAQEVGASPAREAPKASLKRPVDTPTERVEDAARHRKKVKVLTRRHKSHLGEGESRSRSKGKEPAPPSGEPEAPAESRTSPPPTGVGALHAPLGSPDGLSRQGDGPGKLLDPCLVAKAEERASELQEELEKTKRERGEELLRRKASEKELHEV